MNFRELCQTLKTEAGIPGPPGSPLTVVGQTGELGRVVNWIQQSWLDIQSMHNSWRFMRHGFQFVLTPSTRSYTKAAVKAAAGLTHDINRYHCHTLRLYLASEGIATEQELSYVPVWDDFRDTRLVGAWHTTTGRPRFFSVDPQDRLVFDLLPDAAYTVYGDYQREPANFPASDIATPDFPAYLHMIIVWNALIRYAGFEESSAQYTHARNMYATLMARMEDRELEQMMPPCPLV